MARKKKHEEHLNHEAWAIPYGDLITLLLAFFVVMYAISSVNEGKYRVLSDSLFAAFRGTPRTMEPIQVGEKQSGSGADVKTTLVEQSMLEGQPRSLLAPIPVKTGMPTRPAHEGELTAAQLKRAQALQRVADQVERAMDDLVKANLVLVRRNDFWIEVEIRTDILFPSASAQLSPSAVGVIERLGTALAPFPNSIRVEGHTDNRPIRTIAFFSNWELSAARAGSVVRVLEGRGVAPERLAVIGYGEHRPTHSNDTEEGRNANRRVVIVILSTDAALRELPATSDVPPADAPATVQTAPAPGASEAASTASSAPGETPAAPLPPAVAERAPASSNAESTTSGAKAETLAAPLPHDTAAPAPIASEARTTASSLARETLAAPLPPAVSPEVPAAPDATPAIPRGAPSFLAQPAR
ncbi:MAG TPA: flagellar motor protein MotD [Steroidobacteraceae bacterium]|jgi:chemotaxis protein MotB|nr:flagellar motor protein MotD [Steroidobacteraceae bacterium]